MATHDASNRGHRALVRVRALRRQLQRSQTAFAALLGVAAETYRTWDSGRRAAPEPWVAKARALAAREDPARRWSLEALAAELGVHVRTLRDAARTGRLEVIYEHRVVFGHLVPRATRAAGRAFIERYYKQSYSRTAPKPTPPRTPRCLPTGHHGCGSFGHTLDSPKPRWPADRAAGKAVVYQWEARKRRPSPVFWTRIEHLRQTPTPLAAGRAMPLDNPDRSDVEDYQQAVRPDDDPPL